MMVFAGVDLSQTGLAMVPATPEAIASLSWGAVEFVTIGESLPKNHSPRQRAERLVKLRRAAVAWLKRRNPTDIWFEAYPMGSGSLHNIDLVAEMGGSLRDAIFTELGIAPEASPISSARKLLLGSLSQSRLQVAIEGMLPAEVRKLGKQKAAVWAELKRMQCAFQTPDEGDAFVALNFGLHQNELPCLSMWRDEAKPQVCGREE
jgi:hypothetical protein